MSRGFNWASDGSGRNAKDATILISIVTAMIRQARLLSALIPIHVYLFARFTILCDCGLLQDTLVNVFHHPWYSGFSDYVGLINPYGVVWWGFYSLFSQSLSLSVLALAMLDIAVLLLVSRRVRGLPYGILVMFDFLVFYTAPVDLLIIWLLLLGIVYSPLFSLLALYAKVPFWPAPAYYLNYVIHGPLSGLTFSGSWRYFLFVTTFSIGVGLALWRFKKKGGRDWRVLLWSRVGRERSPMLREPLPER